MEMKTVSSRMQSLVILFDMHTDYLKRALEGISAEDSQKRLDTKANHVAWITGSLVQERFEVAGIFGAELHQKAIGLFKDHKGIQEGEKYPSSHEFLTDWDMISPVLREHLVNVTDEKLDEIFKMPDFEMTNYELITFMTYREANMIGQIALWRRLLGYDAMKYM